MIDAAEIREIASQWGVPEQTIERDYALGWLLWGIANHRALHRQLVFRGGTCLKKCYVDTHRYSEDLDFTAFAGAGLDMNDLAARVREVLQDVTACSGVDFLIQQPRYSKPEGGQFIHGKVYYRGPRGTRSPVSVKLDIGLSEPLVMPPVLRKIGHPYTDSLPDTDEVYCYGLEELFAEKLRALGERCRPRDLYDSVYLFRRSDVHAEPSLVLEVLNTKCQAKNVPVPTAERLHSRECSNELREHWEYMLGHQLGQPPSFDDYFGDLDKLLSWLRGDQLPEDELLSIDPDEEWTPPPIQWERGQQARLEPARFAAVNRLVLDVGYKGSRRFVEPYSLRQAKSGHILLYGIRTDNRQLRAYRIDRIQSLSVTRQPFTPVHPVEFTPRGRLSTPPTRRSYRRPRGSSSSGTGRFRSTSPSLVYAIRCSLCGKEFIREKYDTSLRPHKSKESKLDCPGTVGLFVETRWR